MSRVPDQFVIEDDFTLPMEEYTLPIKKLIKKQWMVDLQDYLHKIPPGSLISIASGDSSYENVLLNWLISATVNTYPPLSHILILSLDRPLHKTLVDHGFDSLYVGYKDLLASNLHSENHKRPLAFYKVMVTRLTVMRLMNHWGYDTANYDTDAIILKNPEHLYYRDFKSSDLIGSKAAVPNLSMCAGVFMTKSTPRIGICFISCRELALQTMQICGSYINYCGSAHKL